MAEYFAGGHLRFVDGKWRDDDGNMIEVELVRHGWWIEHDDGVFTCNQCGNAESNKSHFCRYCGAKMLEG